uniref:Uncharacterized protein n=1 Tax=Oryza brachyantha TaxID=4533 RepID=J3MFB2_ORYBR
TAHAIFFFFLSACEGRDHRARTSSIHILLCIRRRHQLYIMAGNLWHYFLCLGKDENNLCKNELCKLDVLYFENT